MFREPRRLGLGSRAVVASIVLLSAAACGPPRQPEPEDGGWEADAAAESVADETPAADPGPAPPVPPVEVEDPSEGTPAAEIEAPAVPPEVTEPETSAEPVADRPPVGEAVVDAPTKVAAAPGAGPSDLGDAAAVTPPPSHRMAYEERRPKSVLELQPFRRVASTVFTTSEGRSGVASLVNLNPSIGAWLLLRIEWVGGGDPEVYHLQNPFPGLQSVGLDTASGTGLVLGREGQDTPCDLWGGVATGSVAGARASGRPFAPLCDGWLYLRNPTEGRRTSREWAADFLRDRVWGGEKVTTLVRDTLFKGSYRRTARLSASGTASAARDQGTPLPPRLVDEAGGLLVDPTDLGVDVRREPGGKLAAGRWYPLEGVPEISVSAVRPDLVAREIVEGQGARVDVLDAKEGSSLVYVVAFDLARLDLGFALGTEHPRVGWSERALASVRDDSLPGPDGIGTVSPLVRTGMLSPAEAVRVVATFTGGFKRSHGAFNAGDLATRNQGSHYGFIEQGAILSKLQPGLSTLAVRRDGRVVLGTWTTATDAGLQQIRYARQNGVPLLESDPETGTTRPGALVKSWGAGNWSGSADKKLRTLRAGACVQDSARGSFLMFGLFTSATPSAMARVFEAYGCRDAMLLDMNALEHTYLAIYRDDDNGRTVEHLIDEMKVLDKVVDGRTVPRFVGFPDNRDFFFMLRRAPR